MDRVQQLRLADVDADCSRMIADIDSPAMQCRRRPHNLAAEHRGPRKLLATFARRAEQNQLTEFVQQDQFAVRDNDPRLTDFGGDSLKRPVVSPRPSGSNGPFLVPCLKVEAAKDAARRAMRFGLSLEQIETEEVFADQHARQDIVRHQRTAADRRQPLNGRVLGKSRNLQQDRASFERMRNP